VFDAIILSDIHLGSKNCQAKNLVRFLEMLADEEIVTSCLVLNGDVFDSIDFRRLNKNHWKVLSLIRKLSDRIDRHQRHAGLQAQV
jgi:UDP-2,3-diacylglucosamine pyrophosphatase LpxH